MAQEYIEQQLDRIETKLEGDLNLVVDLSPVAAELAGVHTKLNAILALLHAGGGAPPVEPGPVDPGPDPGTPPTPNPNRHPSQVLPVLRWWTIMLPTGSQGDPDNEYLVDKSIPNTYFVDSNGAVVFEAPADGVHSPNSKYARSEARQMVPGKEWTKSAWTSADRHELYAELAIDMAGLTGTRPRINGLQIHDGGDDVMQVQFREDGALGVSHADGKSWEVLDPAYPNAAFFTCRITVQNNAITVQYARGGVTKVITIPKRGTGWYWKAGCYINTGGASTNIQPAGARGRVTLRKLEVTPA